MPKCVPLAGVGPALRKAAGARLSTFGALHVAGVCMLLSVVGAAAHRRDERVALGGLVASTQGNTFNRGGKKKEERMMTIIITSYVILTLHN